VSNITYCPLCGSETHFHTEIEIADHWKQWEENNGVRVARLTTDSELAERARLVLRAEKAEAELADLRVHHGNRKTTDFWQERADILAADRAAERASRVALMQTAFDWKLRAEAAERKLDEAREVIEPFERAAGMLPVSHGPDNEPVSDDEPVSISCVGFYLGDVTAGDLERLRTFLASLSP
jgi:hypothetical protein